MQSPIRARLVAAARWLAPSAIAGAAGAVVAGALEGRGMDSGLGMVVAAGFVALLAFPELVVASAMLRGLWAAWQPHQLGLVEPDGSAPRLAGWLGVAVLGTLAVAWCVFQGTWLLFSWTTFKPVPVSYGVPAFAVGAALVAAGVARPAARGFSAIARAIDRRWQRRGRATLLSPRRIAVALAITSLAGGTAFWLLVIRIRLAQFGIDVAVVLPALAGIVVAALAHVVWPRLGRGRPIATAVIAAALLLAIGGALAAWRLRPSLVLAIWGDRPLAGSAIETIFDVRAIRTRQAQIELAPVARPAAPHPDIVLVVLDSTRADHLPGYGGTAAMPALQDLESRGAVFDWAFAPSSIARRSLPAMMVGLSPERVRGRVVGESLRVDPRHALLAERLVVGGYETAAFLCCSDAWDGAMRTGLGHVEIERDGGGLANRLRTWLEARGRSGDRAPLFAIVHVIEPHEWMTSGLEPSAPERGRLYDRALARADDALASVMAAFAARPPIVIVTSDRGESLGEHGTTLHAADLFDAQTRVPLIVAGPGIPAAHVAETVSLVSLVPSVLELAGFAPPTGNAIDGTSFAALATGARAGDPDGGIAFGATVADRANATHMTDVVAGRWKLIANGTVRELYDTRNDPDERANVLATHRDIAARLQRLLDEHRAHTARSPFE